jgi:hypothetical protein
MKKLVVICFLHIFLFSSLLYGQQIIKNLQWLNVNEKITELSIGKGEPVRNAIVSLFFPDEKKEGTW